jgi:hypothetical protein
MSPLRQARSGETTHPPDTAGPDPRSVDGWIAALADQDVDVRRQAVLALAEIPAAIPALVARVGIEVDATVRETVCTQLSRHDVPEVVDGLLDHLSSDDAGLRTAVVEVLSRTPHATRRRIPELLAHPDADVRILTVMVLAALDLDEVGDWLATVIATDSHPNVVSAAVDGVAERGEPRGGESLRVAQERFPDDPFIAFTVGRALRTVPEHASAVERERS